MRVSMLAEQLERRRPEAASTEIARLCLLLLNATQEPSRLEDESYLLELWRQLDGRVESAVDQQTAMLDELEQFTRNLSENSFEKATWTLVRALHVQSQLLQLYLGTSALTLAKHLSAESTDS